MGYTHYFEQTRSLTVEEWSQFRKDAKAIFDYVEKVHRIPLANGMGDHGTSPEITDTEIRFNGHGNRSYETFAVTRVKHPENDTLCKTEYRPYDLAVTAILAYLATIMKSHHVTSDGKGAEWLAGVEVARLAVPRIADQIDIPMPVMESDRWCMPWTNLDTKAYEFRFCVDGHAYIIRSSDGKAYRFETHQEAAEFAEDHRDPTNNGFGVRGADSVFSPFGAFNAKRREHLAHAQARLLRQIFDHGEMFDRERMQQPPAYVRPGDKIVVTTGLGYFFKEVLAEKAA